jgi:GNAT superfamily N-acetyltransferase
MYWEGQAIDQPLVSHLMDSQLHCPPVPDKRSGLMRFYTTFKRLGVHYVSHLWVAYSAEGAVGVALIEDNPSRHLIMPTLQVYVKPTHRRQGIGEQLVQCAVETGESFGAYHTATSGGLYRRFNLTNLQKEIDSVFQLAS